MELTPETVAQEQHKDWLHHPTTVQMLKNLELQKMHYMNKCIAQSSDMTVTDQVIRINAAKAAVLVIMKTWITNTETFLQVAENKIK